jgi:hypothetical protein
VTLLTAEPKTPTTSPSPTVFSAISSLASPQQRRRWVSSGLTPPILRSQVANKPSEPEPFDLPEPTEEDRLREIVQSAARARRITPQAVAAFAALHMQTDDGEPIRPAAHHRLWLDLLCDFRIRKLLIIAPPESAKTTWTILAYLGCRIGMFPQQNVIIGSATADIATARSMSLRAMIDTDAWRQTFPGVLPVRAHEGGLKWGTNQWSVAPNGIPFPGRLHPSVAAAGTAGTVEGGRADEVVGDDLLSRSVSQSPTERKKVEDWAHASFLSRRKAEVGRAVLIGTSQHPDDYLAHARAAGDWVVCYVPLLSDSTDVYATITYPDDVDWNRLGEPVAGAELVRAA